MDFKKSLILLLQLAVMHSVQAQVSKVTVSGQVTSLPEKQILQFVNVILKTEKDSVFVTGTITAADGRFTLTDIAPGNYQLECGFLGFQMLKTPLTVGALSAFVDLGVLEMKQGAQVLQEVTVTAAQADGVDGEEAGGA